LAIRRAQQLYTQLSKGVAMGNYVLYLLMQAFVALIFAYFVGTILFKERRLYVALVSAGFYLLMGSTLVELSGDRGGWTVAGIGLNAALVSVGIAAVGSGALLRESRDMEEIKRMETIGLLFIGVAAAMGAVLALGADRYASFVDPDDVVGVTISGAFTHLGRAGWALGSPLFVGALLIIWMGVRSVVVRGDSRGLWLMFGGVLFLLWPFDVWLGDLPLAPTFLLFAIALTFFGFQLPKPDVEEEEGDGDKDVTGTEEPGNDDGDDDGDDGPAPWVREVIEGTRGDGEMGDGDTGDGPSDGGQDDEPAGEGFFTRS
jgi:hypothetical protein